MLKRIAVVVFLGVSLGMGGGSMDPQIVEKVMGSKCEVNYRFLNVSLGPVLGQRSFRLFLDHGKLLKIIDLRTGKRADPALGTPGLSIVMAWLHGEKNEKYHYRRLEGKEMIGPSVVRGVGGTFRIEIDLPRCISAR